METVKQEFFDDLISLILDLILNFLTRSSFQEIVFSWTQRMEFGFHDKQINPFSGVLRYAKWEILIY